MAVLGTICGPNQTLATHSKATEEKVASYQLFQSFDHKNVIADVFANVYLHPNLKPRPNAPSKEFGPKTLTRLARN